MADFDFLKVKVKFRFLSIIEKAPPLTKRRRLRYCASKSVQHILAAPVPNVLPRRDGGSGKPCEVFKAL